MSLLDPPINPDTSGQFIPRTARSRYENNDRVLFVEDFRAPVTGMWNDGAGSASRDCDVMFAGKPSIRLDTQGVSSGGATNPGRTAITTGVVFKRRVHDGFTGIFGMDGWFRLTSTNNTSNAFLSMSVYNRDGTNAYHSRVWLDPAGNNTPMQARILDGDATAAAAGVAQYVSVSTSVLQNGGGSHIYEPATGRLDRAGGWHYIKLMTNMVTKKYVSLQLDGQAPVDLSAYSMDVTASTGFAGMHFSFEYAGSTSSRRYANIAQVTGYGR